MLSIFIAVRIVSFCSKIQDPQGKPNTLLVHFYVMKNQSHQ